MNFDEALGLARENWRVVLLVVLILSSAVAIFAPASREEGATNLKFGLELNGGTRIRAPLVGTTAEGVDMSGMNRTELRNAREAIASDLGLEITEVRLRPRQNAVEIYTENVSDPAFRSALKKQGFDPARIREGVTRPTRQNAVQILEEKLRSSPQVTGATVTLTRTPGGVYYVQVAVPGATSEQLLEIIRSRGRVRVFAVFPKGAAGGNGNATPTPTPGNGTPTGNATPTPTATPAGNATPTPTATPSPTPTPTSDADGEFEAPKGYVAVPLFGHDDLRAVDQVEDPPSGQPRVPVTLRDRAGKNFSNAMQRFGFTSGAGVSNCRWRTNPEDPGYCLVIVRDGEPVNGFGMGRDLAGLMNRGEFRKTDSFVLVATNMSEARQVQIDLSAGALPTNLDVEEGSITYVGPSQGERFKVYSLITGIIAALAVSVMIFIRYREPKVALPMWLTALAEVFLLLGFAAALPLTLDLAHISGFIAVIGTGVDDLVIIADEVMSQGDVRTRRVFQSRFRKAFWVIGAAAVTTIIAMSPLMVLGLGDLSGFAIVTIVGVLIGVLVTRPAYGDVLRSLVTGEEE